MASEIGTALNDSEWKVMTALWARPRSSVAALHADLEPETGWAYSTVKTLLERLAAKGAVAIERERSGRRFVPLLAERDARRGAFRDLLDRAFGGSVAGLAEHLVGDGTLSKREREELRQALAEERSASAPGKRR